MKRIVEWTEGSSGGGLRAVRGDEEAEGENLKKDILSKLDFLETEIVFVEERSRRSWRNTGRSWEEKNERAPRGYPDRGQPDRC